MNVTLFFCTVDFALKRLTNDDGSITNLALWDIAGQERFGQLLRVVSLAPDAVNIQPC